MSESFAFVLGAPAVALASFLLLPSGLANTYVRPVRLAVTALSGVQFVITLFCAIAFATGIVPIVRCEVIRFAADFPIAVSIYYDGVASLMLALVSFVGWIVSQYSLRYLDGESTQGRYFKWIGFTVGSVSLMVLSGNLLMFLAAWVMTSLGLHQLLLHYGHRQAARRAAWTKFTISRIGDVALVVATVLIYQQFRTLDFAALFAIVDTMTGTSSSMQIAGFLLVLGAATKSAQFPFHTWLPQTMETPTPVSALMHAGIVNAGGYLMIRTSPLVAMAPWAMMTLAIVGAMTACFAAVVMLTQTSVKKRLAYSTIAQMGFMMLQCGLGAFSAAMLHIIAHSLYKAHAFLSSGSVIAELAAMRGAVSSKRELSWKNFAIAGGACAALLAVAFVLTGIDPVTKPGGLLLGSVLCLSLTYWVAQVMRSDNRAMIVRAVVVAGILCALYSLSFRSDR